MNLSKLPDVIQKELPSVMDKFQINTRLRLAHFLAQCAHESANFKLVYEDLRYSANRLVVVHKHDFDLNRNKIIDAEELIKAKKLENHPESIANFVYANQNGNGSESSGDGWKYRGRGYIQLTGRSNYKLFDQYVDENIIDNPDLVATKYPLLSAAWFWNNKKLNILADKNDLLGITKYINGGTNGLKDRENKFNKYYLYLQ